MMFMRITFCHRLGAASGLLQLNWWSIHVLHLMAALHFAEAMPRLSMPPVMAPWLLIVLTHSLWVTCI